MMTEEQINSKLETLIESKFNHPLDAAETWGAIKVLQWVLRGNINDSK